MVQIKRILVLLAILLAAGSSIPADVSAQVVDVNPKFVDKSGDLPGMSSGTSIAIAAGVVVVAIVLWRVLKSDGGDGVSAEDASALLQPLPVTPGAQTVPAWSSPTRTGTNVHADLLMGIGPTVPGGPSNGITLGLSLRR